MPVSSERAARAQAAFLQDAAAVLRPDGLLAVNCVARADSPVREAVRALRARARRAEPLGAHGVSGQTLLRISAV